MRRAAITRAPKGGAISKDESKYKVGSDPLEIETTLKAMEPTALEEHKEMVQVVNLLIEKATDPEEKKGLTIWKTNLEASTIGPHVKKAFVKDFWAWLCGRGRPEDVVKTPWGRQPLTDDPEVEAYVSLFPRKMQAFRLKLFLLASRRPLGINECYLYFKYIVRGDVNATDRDEAFNSEFLKDWQQFGDDFTEARQDGQEYRRPGGSAHEMAPYDQYEKGRAVSKGAEKAATRRRDNNILPPGSKDGQDKDDLDDDFLPDIDEDLDDDKAGQQQKKHDDKGKGELDEPDQPPRSEKDRATRARVHDANELMLSLLVRKATEAQVAESVSRIQQENAAQMGALQAQLVQLREEAETRKATKSGMEGETAEKIAKVEQEMKRLEGEATTAKELLRVAQEEGEKNRQEWSRQHAELTQKLGETVGNLKLSGPREPPGSSGAVAVSVDVGGLTTAISQASNNFTALNEKLTEFINTVDARVKDLAKDTAAGIGNFQAQQQEIQTIRAQMAELNAKVAPGAAITNHPAAVDATLRAADVDRLAGVIQAGLGKQREELVSSWKTFIQENDKAWTERLKTLQSPTVNIDTTSISATIDGVMQKYVAEMTALQGTNQKIISDVDTFHKRTMGEFTGLGKAVAKLNEKIANAPAAPPGMPPVFEQGISDAKAQKEMLALRATMEEQARAAAVQAAAMSDQIAKLKSDLEGQIQERMREKNLSEAQAQQLRNAVKATESKYSKRLDDLGAQLKQSQAAVQQMRQDAQATDADLEERYHQLFSHNLRLQQELEKTKDAYESALARIPKVAPAAPPEAAPAAPTVVPEVPPATPAAPAAAPFPDEEEEEPNDEDEVRYAQAVARGEMEREEFHPTALDEAAITQDLLQLGNVEFSLEEDVTATALAEETTSSELVLAETSPEEMAEASRIGVKTAELQLALDTAPMASLSETLLQAWRMIEAAGLKNFEEEALKQYTIAMEAAQKAPPTVLMPPALADSVKNTLGTAYQIVAKREAEAKGIVGYLSASPVEKMQAQAKKAPSATGKKRTAETGKRPAGATTRQAKAARGKTAPAAGASTEFAKRFQQAEALLYRDKVRLGGKMLRKSAQAAQNWMRQNRQVPTVDQIASYMRTVAAQ